MEVRAKYFVVLIINIALSFSAAGEEKPGQFNRPAEVNAALFGISRLNLKIQGSFFKGQPNDVTKAWRELKNKVSREFEKGGIKVAQGSEKRFNRMPEFTILLEQSRIENSKLRVLCVRSTLSRFVLLSSWRQIQLKAGVWESEPVIFLLPEGKAENITAAVLEQVKAFLKDYNKTKTKGLEGIEAGGLAITRPRMIKGKGQYKYVASKNSKVFHRPGCRWAGRIKPENLVGYESREEAIKAGKRPCKVCKP